MGFYNSRILPWLLDLAMRQSTLQAYRKRTIWTARGRVLEVGVGSGLNLPLYGPAVTEVCAIDPSPELLRLARPRSGSAIPRISLIRASAERLPFADKLFDTVVTTWTLCSIPDALQALREARRVLAPDGRLLFVEHGLAPEPGIARWQHGLTPCWRRISGGCYLDRKIDELIRSAGFDIVQLQTGYMKGPKPMTYMYEGQAQHAARRS
jgi:ubiquinone/menaquinone biosynthesis C-methylase UbiE